MAAYLERADDLGDAVNRHDQLRSIALRHSVARSSCWAVGSLTRTWRGVSPLAGVSRSWSALSSRASERRQASSSAREDQLEATVAVAGAEAGIAAGQGRAEGGQACGCRVVGHRRPRRSWSGDAVALPEGDVEIGEAGELAGGLDALGADGRVDAAGVAHEGYDQGG
jgi:hypothetical protein